MQAVHVSFDQIEKFIPRVPGSRCPNEDNTIPRICVAPDIRSALNAIPQCGQVLEYMRKLGLPVIIHAYYLYGGKRIDNKGVQKYVPDAAITKEFWLVTPPEGVRRVDYVVNDFSTLKDKDPFGHEIWHIFGVRLKRCRFQSNINNLVSNFSCNERKVREICMENSYRTVMSNIGEELVRKKLEVQE